MCPQMLPPSFWCIWISKMKPELPYDPTIPLLGIHTEETRIERDTCTPMFIAAPFTIARTWKQPRCPLADEWIRKLWYIYTMEYYSAIKKNTFESVLMRWMKLGLLYRVREKAMAPHSSTLAWKTPWTEERGRLQSMGSLRVWLILLCTIGSSFIHLFRTDWNAFFI